MFLILKCEVGFLTAKLLKQGYRYHKFRKAFSKFYRRRFELVSKYNVGLKTLKLHGIRAKILVSSWVHRDLNISFLLLQYSRVYIKVESSFMVYLGACACIFDINQCPIHHSSVTL